MLTPPVLIAIFGTRPGRADWETLVRQHGTPQRGSHSETTWCSSAALTITTSRSTTAGIYRYAEPSGPQPFRVMHCYTAYCTSESWLPA